MQLPCVLVSMCPTTQKSIYSIEECESYAKMVHILLIIN